MAIYPISLFFSFAKSTKERSIKIKSLLIDIGLSIGTMAYAIEITGAIAYQYMMVYRSMILIGSFLMFLGQFIYPAKPSIPISSSVFSTTLGLDHKQIIGIANAEQIFVFTRKGSAIHSVLGEHKNVKFFYLTQQLSVQRSPPKASCFYLQRTLL